MRPPLLLLLEGLHSLLKRHWIPLLARIVCVVLFQSRTSRLPVWLLPPMGCVLSVGDVCAAAPLSVLLLLWMGALGALDGLILLSSPWCGHSFCWEGLLLLAVSRYNGSWFDPTWVILGLSS